MTHKELTTKLIEWLLTRPGIDLAIDEMRFGRGIVDAIGITTRPKYKPFKVLAVEAKVSRSDLLQDLNKGKMLKYEQRASHCYLACDRSVLKNSSYEEFVEDITNKGLPKHWGILIVDKDVTVIRRAQRIRPISISTIRQLSIKIGKSYMWKNLRS